MNAIQKKRYFLREYQMLSQIRPVKDGVVIKERFTSRSEILSYDQLCQRYNDLIEDIWLRLERIDELYQENEELLYAYEKVTDELYG